MKIIVLAILPNWDSLDSVRQVHSDLELAGLVFFALLVIAEALAHNCKQEERKHLFDSIGIWFFAIAVLCEIAGYWYGRRNDALSGQIIISLDAKAQSALGKSEKADNRAEDAETKADKATTKSGNAVAAVEVAESASSNALALAKEAQKAIAWRHLSSSDAKKIRDAIPASLRGLKIEVRHLLSDPEAGAYASEIADALRPILDVDGSSGYLGPWGTIPQGIEICATSVTMPGAADVQRALKAGGIEAPGALLSVRNLSSSSGLVVFVWPKPAPVNHKKSRTNPSP